MTVGSSYFPRHTYHAERCGYKDLNEDGSGQDYMFLLSELHHVSICMAEHKVGFG